MCTTCERQYEWPQIAEACCLRGRYKREWYRFTICSARIMFDGTHLATNGPLEGLHAFSRLIGLQRRWYQDHPRHPHYDVFGKPAEGLQPNCTARELVRVCYRKGGLTDDR
jgi:hypothetical protein